MYSGWFHSPKTIFRISDAWNQPERSGESLLQVGK